MRGPGILQGVIGRRPCVRESLTTVVSRTGRPSACGATKGGQTADRTDEGCAPNTGPFPGHSGHPYGPFAGLALEARHWPDAPNQPGFPQVTLDPGEVYRQVTQWRFAGVGH